MRHSEVKYPFLPKTRTPVCKNCIACKKICPGKARTAQNWMKSARGCKLAESQKNSLGVKVNVK